MSPQRPVHPLSSAVEPPDPIELAALIATLHATEARLEEITSGEVDSVTDRSGRPVLLRRAQDALQASEVAEHAAILNTLPLQIALIDKSGKIVAVNAAWAEYGRANASAEQCRALGVGSNYLDVCDGAVGDCVAEARQASAGIRSVLDGKTPAFTFEYPCHSPKQRQWFQMTVSPVTSDSSVVAVVIHLDVSGYRLAKLESDESELRFRQLAENIREVFFLRAINASRLLYVSPAFEEIWGRSCESLYADSSIWAKAIHPDDRDRTIEKVCSGRYDIDYRVVRPDGAIRWVHSRGYPVYDRSGSMVRVASVVKDITDEKITTEALKESQQRLSLATESAQIGIWDLDVSAKKTYWDARMYALYGITEQAGSDAYRAWQKGLHPEDRSRAESEWLKVVAGGQGFHSEFRVVWPNGEVHVLEAHAQVRRGDDGVATRVIGINWDITARKRAESELYESERRYRELLGNVELFAVMLDLDGQITFCNDYLLRTTGWQRAEIIGRNWFDLFIPAHDSDIRKAFAALVSEAPSSWHRENQILTRDGELRLVNWNNSVLRSAEGAVIGSASIGEDVTDRKKSEARILHLNRVYAILSGINTLITRAHNREELFSETCRIAVETGGLRMAMIGNVDPLTGDIDSIVSSGKDTQLLDRVKEFLISSAHRGSSMVGTAILEKRVLVANDSQQDPRVLLGEHYAQSGVRSLAVFPLIVSDEAVGVLVLYAGEVEFFHEDEIKLLTELAGDIAFAMDHIEKSRRLHYLAFYDSLTGLPNANLFKNRLDQFINLGRHTLDSVCVVVIDLERFTQFNDSQGRSAGDELLRAVAKRLQQFLVEPYALGRIGADTYAVACPLNHDAAPSRLSDCISLALEQPFLLAGRDVKVVAQAGIALFPADGDDGETVFKNAESSLMLGKASGARTTYFSRELSALVAQRYALEQELRVAVGDKAFVVHYQPRVDMISGELVGAEALIRWQHPSRGTVPPVDFIALAEATGLIVPIGAWVLETVCAQQSAWIAAGVAVVPVAVNLSSIQFEKGGLVESVASALALNRLEPRLLVLELTESAVMNDPKAAALALHALRKIGVGLALDDFGTGYSSLAHLKHFPFDSVKIDRSFVIDITSNPGDAAIATAIIAMAHGLNLKVVAEGVETQGQFNYLRSKSCDEMQGFLFGPGVPAQDFEEQLRSRRRLSLPTPTLSDQRTLLIVDDEQGIRSALIRMLRSDGYRILQADGGQAGLDLLAINDVQVIISDQRMAGMTGTEFLSTVSQIYPNTVRMILSGFTDLKVVTDSVNRGSEFKFLTKPWDDEDLREQVRDAFRRYRVPKS